MAVEPLTPNASGPWTGLHFWAGIFKDAALQWTAERAPRMAAALAFYTIFSLAPLLVIVVATASLVFQEEQVEESLVRELQGLVGPQGASALRTVLQSVRRQDSPEGGILATLVGLAMLLFGSSGVFAELQDSLNTVWDVKAKSAGGLLAMVRRRFSAFVMVLGTGFLLVVSLVLSAAVSAIVELASGHASLLPPALHATDFLLSLLFVAVLFGFLYRLVPDARIGWSDVWPGAVVAALLFSVGKVLLGLYLGRSTFASSYGAAGSLVVILVWVYYTAQILFFGAELTQVYASARHSVAPSPHAYHATSPAKLAAAVEGRMG